MRGDHGISRMVWGTLAGNWLLTFPLALFLSHKKGRGLGG